MSRYENETYEKLKILFNKKVDKQELTREWANTYLESEEIKELSVENRKKHYISFMIEKYKEADLYDETVEKDIKKEADTLCIYRFSIWWKENETKEKKNN